MTVLSLFKQPAPDDTLRTALARATSDTAPDTLTDHAADVECARARVAAARGELKDAESELLAARTRLVEAVQPLLED